LEKRKRGNIKDERWTISKRRDSRGLYGSIQTSDTEKKKKKKKKKKIP